MGKYWLDELSWTADGLIPVIVVDDASGKVLMQAWMNRESLQLTVKSGHTVFWSRSRQQLWHKGEQSGHRQIVKEIRLDCDNDTLLVRVEQQGGIACHTGRQSCFFRKLEDDDWVSVEPVIKDPRDIYPKSVD